MPPVTGEPQVGGEEYHEKGRPPDEINEGDKMDTSLERLPSALTSKSTEISAEDTEQLKPSASRKGKRKLESPETHPHFPDGFQSEDEESADGLGPWRSDSTDPYVDRHHRDSFPQTPYLDSSFDSLAGTRALNLALQKELWLSGEKQHPGISEHTIQQQRARLVHGAWESIENVRNISSSLLVNKPQCEHIADHFNVTGDVLQKLGLLDDFVSSQASDIGSGIRFYLTLNETRFVNIAKSFKKHLKYERDFQSSRKMEAWLRKFHKCIRKLPTMDGSSREASLSRNLSISFEEIVDERSDYWMEHDLDKFLWLLFEVLKHGEDLVLFHWGLEKANNGVVERTGIFGEKFVEIHELLYGLLDYYACLEHCKGTEFASGYISGCDVCIAESILYYWNSNLVQKADSLIISNNFLSIEMANMVATMLRDSNYALKKLSIESSPGAEVDQEELRKCSLMIIAALSENVGLTDLSVRASNGEEVHELCESLRANRVLENLVISTGGPLADNDAMDLSAIVTENRSLKTFRLEFDDVSPDGVVYLGAILTVISLDEIYLRSRGLRGFMKYLLGLSMACIDGKLNAILSVKDCHSFLEMQLYVCTGPELPMDGTEILRIVKARNCLSISFGDLDPDAVCEVLDFLKKNKTLQVLTLESCPRDGRKLGDNREVAACLEAVLAENSGVTELKVQFRVWDKCFVQHLLRPLMAEKDGEPHVNISLRQLQIISNAEFSPNVCGEVAKSIARMLRTNKTLTHFFIRIPDLRTSDVCEILDSLKLNKALKKLYFDKHRAYHNPQVKEAFIDLLVNYNFTLMEVRMPAYFMSPDSFVILDTPMALKELRSHFCTTSNCPIVEGAHDLKQQVVKTLQLEEKGEGLIEEGCGSSKRAFDKHKSEVEAIDERPRLFLSYSNEMRDFASLLCKELKSSNYNVVVQDSVNFVEDVDQFQLAIVVLSDMYMKSKPLMSELCTIVKSKKTNNPTLKVYPLFYKLTLHDLQTPDVLVNTIDGEGSSLDIASKREALNFLCEGKNEVSRRANDLVENLSQGRVGVVEFCEEFSELQRSFWPSNGLEVEKNAISEEGYLHAIVEEISHYMPAVKEQNDDQTSSHQGKLEMESKLSLRQMKSVLESLPMRNFHALRKFNMAQYLQEKYILYSSFEEMFANLSPDQKNDCSRGRIAAVLFPTTFLYHFKVHMFQDRGGANFPGMLEAAAKWVAKMMESEVQTSTFFDFVDYGAPLDPRGMIAMCQNFSMKTSNDSTQLVIVQDELTRAYYYQCVEASNLENLPIDWTIGVIGVKVTSIEIHVEIMWEDGSYYSGALEDFSYDLERNDNQQCALEAFGDLKGAHFLETHGLKCSPLLVIALAMAIHKKGSTLTWKKGKGHIEIDSILPFLVPMEQEVWECQILYGDDINQLGEIVEWGMNQLDHNCASSKRVCRKNQSLVLLEHGVDGNIPISNISNDTSIHTQSNVDLSAVAAQFHAGSQNKQKYSIGVKVLGSGIDIGFEKQNSKGKKVEDQSFKKMQEVYWVEKGGYVIRKLSDRHELLEEKLRQGSLYAERDLNYLVVYDGCTASHVSIYWVKEWIDEPRLELEWITDIFIAEGPEGINSIFKGLRGETLKVTRKGTQFCGNPSQKQSKGLMKRFINRLLNKGSCKGNALQMVSKCEDRALLILEGCSNDEWEHIVGIQPDICSNKYWWKASYMQAITYSRTKYSSGCVLSTYKTEKCGLKLGSCRRFGLDVSHKSDDVESCGKFSKPPQSLPSKWHDMIHWGGLEESLV